ncbi:MAG: hypothetical protein ACYC8T_06035 [Myxococcaceae bacterium]
MKRILSVTVLAAAMMATGCSRYFIQKDAYSAVKKAAVVQYAINPAQMLGTAMSDDVRMATAERNVASFLKEMNGKPYELMPLADVIANDGYKAAGKDAEEHFYTAKGMRFFSPDLGALMQATLAPDEAKKLCAALGVDAVVTMFDAWGQRSAGMGFQARANNTYYVNMYDKNGTRVWGDVVMGLADNSVAAPAGIIATDPESMIANHNEAFGFAMKDLAEHLAAK